MTSPTPILRAAVKLALTALLVASGAACGAEDTVVLTPEQATAQRALEDRCQFIARVDGFQEGTPFESPDDYVESIVIPKGSLLTAKQLKAACREGAARVTTTTGY